MSQAIIKFPDLRVLAIEDYMGNLEILEAMLLDLACDFEIVDSTAKAVELHEAQPFDVILLDTLIPDVNAQEAMVRIRNTAGHGKLAQIILATPCALLHDADQQLNAIISLKLTKPIKIHDLEKAFLHLVPHKALTR